MLNMLQVWLVGLALPLLAAAPTWAAPLPASSIPDADLIEPAQLAARLHAPQGPPLVLQVGFHKLYVQAHIPGAEYVGAASEEEGVKALRERMEKLPRDTPVILYCGCCPWTKCPNVGTAYKTLRELGFEHVKVLHVVKDFGTDWVDKGYPVASSS